MKEIRALREQRRDLDNKIQAAIRTKFPIGSSIRWNIGERIQRGTVMNHGFRERLLVRNEKTEKTYWIDAYYVVE